MLPGQMSSLHLKSVSVGPRNLPFKFGQNWVSNSWDIADIEFVWVVGGGWVVVVCKPILVFHFGPNRFGFKLLTFDLDQAEQYFM